MELKLIEGNTLFIDGSKIRAKDKNEEGTLVKLPEELIGKEKLKKRIECVS